MYILFKIFRFAIGLVLLAAIACSGNDKEDKDVYETQGPYDARENVEKSDSLQDGQGPSISADSVMQIINRPQ